MFNSREPKKLNESATLEEAIRFMNELSVKLHNLSLRQSGIDPDDIPSPYDLSKGARWTQEGGPKRPNY